MNRNRYLIVTTNSVVLAAGKNIIHSWTELEEIVLKENYTLSDRRALVCSWEKSGYPANPFP
jgi:hypothetical protein